ncbi:MAG: hypothetical protein GY929_02000 [Actinomycetia bacterium]|nr:hypothetical protein [Actinomycetes bacterium]
MTLRPTNPLLLDREERGYEDDHECSGDPAARCPACFREHGTGCDPEMVAVQACPLCANSACGWCFDDPTGLCTDCREPVRSPDLDRGGLRGWSVRELDLLIGVDTVSILTSLDVTTLLAVSDVRHAELERLAELGRVDLDRVVDIDLARTTAALGGGAELPPSAEPSILALVEWLRAEAPPLPEPTLIEREGASEPEIEGLPCDACGDPSGNTFCPACLGSCCQSCAAGTMCPACAVVGRGIATSVEGLPAGLLLGGLVAAIAHDKAKTVIAAAGSRRREFIVLRDAKVVQWDHLGPGPAEELCLILASQSEHGDLGLEIDDCTTPSDLGPVVQVTVRLVGGLIQREANYPVSLESADETTVSAALRGLTPEWSGVRPTKPDAERADLLDGLLPEMRGEPDVWLEMKVEPIKPE